MGVVMVYSCPILSTEDNHCLVPIQRSPYAFSEYLCSVSTVSIEFMNGVKRADAVIFNYFKFFHAEITASTVTASMW